MFDTIMILTCFFKALKLSCAVLGSRPESTVKMAC